MVFSVRVIRLVAAVAFASALLAGSVHAETVNVGKWGFSVVFGCQSQPASQSVATAVGKITMTSYSCSTRDAGYFVAVADYPAHSINQKSIDDAYTGAINGAAGNVKGKIRSVAPYRLGHITGRDALIDLKVSHRTAHLRIFYVRDRQFQLTFVGPTGQENSKACLDFLNSFVLAKAGK